MKLQIPKSIIQVIDSLNQAGYEGVVVGGAVRDMLLGQIPKDWDIATNAPPDEIQKIFPDSLCENQFGTVGVKLRQSSEATTPTEIVEVTTYRTEESYSDQRHPDAVKFSDSLQEDLARRDFTVNAMAYGASRQGVEFAVIDPFNGRQDLDNKLIRAVGDPTERFKEDALRLMRAVRLASELEFKIEPKTYQAIIISARDLKRISVERIRDEFMLLLATDQAAEGIRLLTETELLKTFLPELAASQGVAQNKHHIYDVYEHLVHSLDYAVKKKYSLTARLAALFHDIGKPQAKRGQAENATFYNHEMVGADMADSILHRLKFSNDLRKKVVLLVRYHQFYYTPEEVTASSVRRLLKNVGLENIAELLQVREADRIGSGVPKAVPYKLRHLQYMIEQVQTDPVTVKMLAVNGDDLQEDLGLKPSPKMGLILNSLLAEVLENPQLNDKSLLLAKAKELSIKDEADLRANLAKIKQAQAQQEAEIKKKYYVQ